MGVRVGAKRYGRLEWDFGSLWALKWAWQTFFWVNRVGATVFGGLRAFSGRGTVPNKLALRKKFRNLNAKSQ